MDYNNSTNITVLQNITAVIMNSTLQNDVIVQSKKYCGKGLDNFHTEWVDYEIFMRLYGKIWCAKKNMMCLHLKIDKGYCPSRVKYMMNADNQINWKLADGSSFELQECFWLIFFVPKSTSFLEVETQWNTISPPNLNSRYCCSAFLGYRIIMKFHYRKQNVYSN